MYNVGMGGNSISFVIEQIPHEFPRTQLHWSAEEDALLWGYYAGGMAIAELADQLLRRPGEIRRRLFHIGLEMLPDKDRALGATWSGRNSTPHFVSEAL